MVEEILRTSLFALLFFLHITAVGLAASSGAGLPEQPDAKVNASGTLFSIAVALGFVIDLTLASALAFLGLLNVPAVVIVVVLSSAMAFVLLVIRRRMSEFVLPKADSLFLLLLLVVTVASAFSVPGRFGDDLEYHLPAARIVAAHHGLTVAPFLRFPLFPQSMEVLFAVGMMTAGVAGAQFVASLPFAIICVGLLAVSRMLFGSIAPGLLAILGTISLPFVRGIFGCANVDLALGLCCFYALVALLVADRSGSRPWIILAGVFAGASCAIKYFGLPFAALLMLYVAARRRSFSDVLAFGLAASLIGGAWYVRNWAISGDPLHPVLGNLFGHYLWNADDLARQAVEQRWLSDGRSGTLALIMRPKALVAIFLLALLTSVTRRLRPELLGLTLIILAYCTLWLPTTKVLRYLLPVLPAVALMFGAAAWRGSLWVLERAGKGPLANAGDRTISAVSIALATVAAIFAVTHARDDLMHRNQLLSALPGYGAFTLASRLRPALGNRMVQLGFGKATYFFTGETIGNWFGPGRYAQMMRCPRRSRCEVVEPNQMRRLLYRFKAQMVTVDSREYAFNEAAYMQDFNIVYRGRDGSVLMTPKPAHVHRAEIQGQP
jgi:hypothetical protein